ncbi:RNA-binding protein 4F [Geranomyces variabilis]|uniref:RNA-binding protein 4F n=1 Tax=Geranomyces variabilis TaxID=109894 RepID=A0AAD5XN19_9FUNG|nr:RNA-binding protein 4F [Geranomyces variabilis]
MELDDVPEPAVSSAELTALSEQLAASPYDFDAHVKYITELRRAGDIGRLKTAREHMAQTFPLPENLWKEWVGDESKIATTTAEKNHVLGLYKRACEDYLSCDLWSAYLSFVTEEYDEQLENGDDENPWLDLDGVRAIFDQADQAVGLHYTDGFKVWAAYRDFEMALCKRMSDASRGEQVERIREMYLKRLHVPHAQLRETLAEYAAFEKELDPAKSEERLKQIMKGYAKTEKICHEYDTSEEALVSSDHALSAYLNYLGMEKLPSKGANAARVRTLYERAIARHSLDSTLWDAYITDMMVMIDDELFIISIAQRAVRNCPWVAQPWSHLMRAMELYGRPAEEIEATYQRAFGMVSSLANMEEDIKLMQTRHDYKVRRVDWTQGASQEAKRAIECLVQDISAIHTAFPPGDPYLRLERTLLRIYLDRISDFDAARELFGTVTYTFPQQSEIWVLYAEFERQHGAPAHARAIFKKSSAAETDWPERIFESWLQFEREYGDVMDYYSALATITKKRATLETARVWAKTDSQPGPKVAAATKKSSGARQAQPKESRKHPRDPDADDANASSKGKKHKSNGNATPGSETVAAPEKAALPKPKPSEYHTVNSEMGGHMLYVTNLPSDVSESQLKDEFAKHGQIIDLYIQPNPETHETEAYVEFANVEQVREAYTVNGTELAGSTLQVARCKSARVPRSGFAGAKEAHKIFVSNLPTNTVKGDLRKIFEKFGKLGDIRLVVKDKTFAYIEFVDKESAAASLQADGTGLHGKTISVAISNPSIARADSKEVYMANLPDEINDADVKALFKDIGPVHAVRLQKTPDGRRFKGSAFVEFQTAEHAKAALSLNGTQWREHAISVTVPIPRGGAFRARGGGHRGGRGGYRGGGGPPRAGLGQGEVSNGHGVAGSTYLKQMTPSSLVPRTAARAGPSKTPKPVTRSEPKNGSAATTASSSSSRGPAPPHAGSKNQDDFRKMLAGKK